MFFLGGGVKYFLVPINNLFYTLSQLAGFNFHDYVKYIAVLLDEIKIKYSWAWSSTMMADVLETLKKWTNEHNATEK